MKIKSVKLYKKFGVQNGEKILVLERTEIWKRQISKRNNVHPPSQ